MRYSIRHHRAKKVWEHRSEISALAGHLKRSEAVQAVDCHRLQQQMAYDLEIAAVNATCPLDLDSPAVGIATLQQCAQPKFSMNADKRGKRFVSGVRRASRWLSHEPDPANAVPRLLKVSSPTRSHTPGSCLKMVALN